MEQRIFRFSKNVCDWTGTASEAKKMLGGKGAGLSMMATDGMPVPPGFTITTDVCNTIANMINHDHLASYKDALMDEVEQHDTWLGQQFGFMPLVSVRSGAPISMPGMMDTILNVGLTNANIGDWAKRLGARAAWDSYRRLIQMLGSTAFGVDMAKFDFQMASIKKSFKVEQDADLSEEAIVQLAGRYEKVFSENTGHEFPQTRYEQMRAAVEAVFNSWMNPRAIEYRKINNIDAAMGTAVNIQAMVFGNMGDSSGTGVLFSRDPSTGEKKVMGEFLQNAQGEDVVAGIRTPVNLDKMPAINGQWSVVHTYLLQLTAQLENTYKDMVDIEFTVQDGKLFILQSRGGKRSARAAFKIAVDQVSEGLIDRKTAIGRLNVEQFKVVRRPSIDPKFSVSAHKVGLPACPGVVTGKPVFSAEDAINCKEPCILVTHETTPDDIAGMNAAVGILTQTGGATSHAAVVARAMDKACVVGCTSLDLKAVKNLKIQRVTLDGTTGKVWFEIEVPVIDSSDAPELKTVTEWCLNVMGACELAPVDIGMEKPHTIMAAYWWGNEDVLSAVLDGIADLPSRQHVALDVRAPSTFVPSEDKALEECFGTNAASDKFAAALENKLLARANELAGMSIVYADPSSELAASPAFTLPGSGNQVVPPAVPADYAAFNVLGR